MTSSSHLHSLLVTKQEYEEHGSNYTYRKFNNIMKKQKREEHVEQAASQTSYMHLFGKGSLVSQIHNYLKVGNDIKKATSGFLNNSTRFDNVHVHISPKWNDNLFKMNKIAKSDIDWSPKNNKLRLKFF